MGTHTHTHIPTETKLEKQPSRPLPRAPIKPTRHKPDREKYQFRSCRPKLRPPLSREKQRIEPQRTKHSQRLQSDIMSWAAYITGEGGLMGQYNRIACGGIFGTNGSTFAQA